MGQCKPSCLPAAIGNACCSPLGWKVPWRAGAQTAGQFRDLSCRREGRCASVWTRPQVLTLHSVLAVASQQFVWLLWQGALHPADQSWPEIATSPQFAKVRFLWQCRRHCLYPRRNGACPAPWRCHRKKSYEIQLIMDGQPTHPTYPPQK